MNNIPQVNRCPDERSRRQESAAIFVYGLAFPGHPLLEVVDRLANAVMRKGHHHMKHIYAVHRLVAAGICDGFER